MNARDDRDDLFPPAPTREPDPPKREPIDEHGARVEQPAVERRNIPAPTSRPADDVKVSVIQCSDELGALAEALAAAQGEITSAEKDRENPYFKSSYATLDAVWNACRAPLSKHGLAVVQLPDTTHARSGWITLHTMLIHKTGQRIQCRMTAEQKERGVQAMGSVITYLRRYSLQSMVGVAPKEDDDDGNATDRGPSPAQQRYEQKRAQQESSAQRTPTPSAQRNQVAAAPPPASAPAPSDEAPADPDLVASILASMVKAKTRAELEPLPSLIPANISQAQRDTLTAAWRAAKTRVASASPPAEGAPREPGAEG